MAHKVAQSINRKIVPRTEGIYKMTRQELAEFIDPFEPFRTSDGAADSVEGDADTFDRDEFLKLL
jgi:hypothetical protein